MIKRIAFYGGAWLLAAGLAAPSGAGESAADAAAKAAPIEYKTETPPKMVGDNPKVPPPARAAQIFCPVTGKPAAEVSKPVVVEIAGFRLWTADEAAAERARRNPAAAFAALDKNGDQAEPVSQACPVMGHKIDKKQYIFKDGRRIYICCRGCFGRVAKNWDAMLKKVEALAKAGPDESVKPM